MLREKLDKDMADFEDRAMHSGQPKFKEAIAQDNLFDKRERFRLVKVEADKKVEERKNELLGRMQQAEGILAQKQVQMDKERKLKQEMRALKEKQKTEHLMRHKRTQDYKRGLYLNKLQAQEEVFNEVRALKHDLVQERYYNKMIDQIKKDEIKKTVEQMQVDRKYDRKKIEEITNEFEFLGVPEAERDTMGIEDSPERLEEVGKRYTTGAGGKRLLKALKVVNSSRMSTTNSMMARTMPHFGVDKDLSSAGGQIRTPKEAPIVGKEQL